MADFYRATKIEDLDRKHPGLMKFVEEQWDQMIPHSDIAGMLQELYGEEVNPQTLSNHYRLRYWPRKNRLLESDLAARAEFRNALALVKDNPDCDTDQMVQAFTANSIIRQRHLLADVPPLQLMKELRQWRESAGNFAIEKEKLALDRERLEKEKKELELKLDLAKRQREFEHKAVGGVLGNKKLSDEEARRKIQEMYGIFESTEQRDPASPLPEEVGQ